MKNGKVIVIGGQHAGERFVFSEAPILIGSSEECAIRLTDRGVLPNHASIDRTSTGGWLLATVGDAGDIEVRGQPVAEIPLEPGLVFRLGGVALRFEAGEESILPPDVSLQDPPRSENAEALVSALHAAHARMIEQIGRVIIGHRTVVEQVLV